MPQTFQIAIDDLSDESSRDLVRLHLEGMHANSPPGSVFAFDMSALTASDVTVWTARYGARAIAMGALRQHDSRTGEIKSMRTRPNYLGKGVGAAILETIITEARKRGLERLSLETGSGDAFEPALRLYRKRGFQSGPAFADYSKSAFNQFMHLDLR